MLQETLHGFLSGRHEKRELRFLKNHRPKDQVFLVKGGEGWERVGGGNLYRTGVSIEGMKQCFPLICMNFIVIMLFTQQVFHLQYLFSFYLILNQVSAC